ncbi:hypothetical protein GGP65_002139 [Salinibacter ruber]|nr:hypothetical protein [Salinibacter ruber]
MWGRDMCNGTCKDGSPCLNSVSEGEMYCRHHKGQITPEDKKEIERKERKNTVIAIVGGIVIALMYLLAAAGG